MLNITVTILVLLSSLGVSAQETTFTFPKGISPDLKFGMSLAEFKQTADMKTMRIDDTRSWRKVLYQPSEYPEIKSLIYYFAKDVFNKPLYEVIITYSSTQQAIKKASQYFGSPNFIGEDSEEPNEWRFAAADKDLPKWVWVYKDQIVIVAKVPGSEWDEDWGE